MIRQSDDGRAEAERLLRGLEEKDSKMRKKWVDVAAKIARAWRKERKLKPLYMVDAYGKRRELVHRIHFHGFVFRWDDNIVGVSSTHL